MLGIFLRILSVALLTAMSAVVHHLAQSLPVGQIMVWRSFVAAIVIFAIGASTGPLENMLPKNYRAHGIRGGLGAISMLFSFVSLAYLPVAHASALAYLAPIMILPLATRSLGETLTGFIWVAAVFGFLGVCLILWTELSFPLQDNLALIGIGAGLAFAATMAVVRVHIKQMTVRESSTSIALTFAIVSGALGLFSLPLGWVALDATLLFWLASAGVLGGLAHLVSVEAVKRSKVSTLAPFEYVGLIFALGIDVALFHAAPKLIALAGMGLIVAAGLLIIWRQSKA